MSDTYTPRHRLEVALTPDGPTLRHFGRHCSCERCDKARRGFARLGQLLNKAFL